MNKDILNNVIKKKNESLSNFNKLLIYCQSKFKEDYDLNLWLEKVLIEKAIKTLEEVRLLESTRDEGEKP